jgi:hypothetical protein
MKKPEMTIEPNLKRGIWSRASQIKEAISADKPIFNGRIYGAIAALTPSFISNLEAAAKVSAENEQKVIKSKAVKGLIAEKYFLITDIIK